MSTPVSDPVSTPVSTPVSDPMSAQTETFLDAASGMTLIDAPVTVSEAAGARVAAVLAKSPGKRALRVSVEGGGCSGFSYKFDLTERAPNDDDQVIEVGGGTVYVDPVSAMYMGGSQLDYVEDFMGKSFQVRNPNATANCGCGTSFSI